MTMTNTIATMSQTQIIDAAALQNLIERDPNVRLLDVRTGAEFEATHIAGSYNVPLDAVAEHARDLAEVNNQVVLICQSGGRASQAHEKLARHGKDSLFILDGGMNAWLSAQGDVVNGSTSRWAMDRQVRGVAGSLALAGIVGSIIFPRAKWLSAGVGGGLLFSAVSNTCAMATVLAKLPYNRSDDVRDMDSVINEMKDLII